MQRHWQRHGQGKKKKTFDIILVIDIAILFKCEVLIQAGDEEHSGHTERHQQRADLFPVFFLVRNSKAVLCQDIVDQPVSHLYRHACFASCCRSCATANANSKIKRKKRKETKKRMSSDANFCQVHRAPRLTDVIDDAWASDVCTYLVSMCNPASHQAIV